jgi:peroxiredoxin
MSTRRTGRILVMILSLCAALGAGCSRVPHLLAPMPVVASSAELTRPLEFGMPAPDITYLTAENAPIALSAFWTKKPVVLIYYRGGWCPYCTRQLMGLPRTAEKLKRMGYTTLVVGADKPESIRKYASPGVDFEILSDHTMEGAKAFGIAFHVDDETVARYKEVEIDLEAESGETHHILPIPAVFIIGRDGVIHFSYANPDYKVRIANDAILFAAEKSIPPEER